MKEKLRKENIIMNKKIIEPGSGGFDIHGFGHIVVKLDSNYGDITYDTKSKELKLNNQIVSNEEYELENVYKAIIHTITIFMSM